MGGWKEGERELSWATMWCAYKPVSYPISFSLFIRSRYKKKRRRRRKRRRSRNITQSGSNRTVSIEADRRRRRRKTKATATTLLPCCICRMRPVTHDVEKRRKMDCTTNCISLLAQSPNTKTYDNPIRHNDAILTYKISTVMYCWQTGSRANKLWKKMDLNIDPTRIVWDALADPPFLPFLLLL